MPRQKTNKKFGNDIYELHGSLSNKGPLDMHQASLSLPVVQEISFIMKHKNEKKGRRKRKKRYKSFSADLSGYKPNASLLSAPQGVFANHQILSSKVYH